MTDHGRLNTGALGTGHVVPAMLARDAIRIAPEHLDCTIGPDEFHSALESRVVARVPVHPVASVPDIAYIALGSNLGDRSAYLERARDAIGAIPECRVVAESSVEETEPLGGLAQPPYLNQMIAVETTLEPVALLRELHRIETAAGRVRSGRWASRTLDLDIVLFDDRVVNDSDLIIPHPALAERPFWHRELAELRDAMKRTSDE